MNEATPTAAPKLWQWVILGVSLIIAALLFVAFFVQLPTQNTSLGIDLLYDFFPNGDIVYLKTVGLRSPPWSVLPLMLLAQFPKKVAWGLQVYFTLLIVVLSVPRNRKTWLTLLTIVLVCIAFPTLRTFADAQIDGLILAGMLLIIYAFPRQQVLIMAAGLLLATAKPQMVFIALLVLALYLLQAWTVRRWLSLGAVLLVVIIPFMLWRGADWIASLQGAYEPGSIMDVTLGTALRRLEIVPPILIEGLRLLMLGATLWTAWRWRSMFTRELAGLLMATSLLLAPYAGANAPFIIIVIGVVPLMQRHFWVGFLLITGVNLLAIPHFAFPVELNAYFTTLYMVIAWAALWWNMLRLPEPQASANQTSELGASA